MQSLKKYSPVYYALAGCLFAWLFYGEEPGLNIFLFEMLLLTLYFIVQRGNINFRSTFFRITFTAYLVSLFAVVWVNSVMALTIHVLLFLLMAGFTYEHRFRSAFNLLTSSLEKLFNLPEKIRIENPPKVGWVKYGLAPFFLVLFFMVIYSFAVPNFGEKVSEALRFFRYLNISYILLFAWGTVISIFFLKSVKGNLSSRTDANDKDDLFRKRTKWLTRGLNQGLKREFISALILLALMNVLVAVVLVFDISAYWFNYDQLSYDEAKTIVHIGCYLLIFSIVFSTIIALYLFRNSLNFYPKNTLLLQLTNSWLLLNVLMVLSVIIKNCWYIDAYNLAHKRIGVFIFLIATLFGIATVLIKINRRKSLSYLLKWNTAFTGLLLVLCSCVNWDKLIVRYNLARADEAYIHTLYLVSLDESTFPLLLKHPEILNKNIEWDRKMSGFYHKYNNVATYKEILRHRMDKYLVKEKDKSWKSWNYRDRMTLKELTTATIAQ